MTNVANQLETRSEVLFLYDVIDANPNGDPNDENRPRMDLESGKARVSDVRLKRTIRDYLHAQGEEIFCREIEKDDGTIQEGKDRAEDFFKLIEDEAKNKTSNVIQKRDFIERMVVDRCIDVRLFGATIPVAKPADAKGKDSSVTLTGPVQFAMGGSLHRVEPQFIKGTGAFASGQGAQQRTFREEYVLPYALIAFYGIVNHQAGKTTGLKVDDVENLYEAMWFGTKELITRSKIGQRPLLLIVVEYKREHANAYIGRLDRFLTVTDREATAIRGESIRDAGEVTLNLKDLIAVLARRKESIERVRFAHDERLPLSSGFSEHDGAYKIAEIKAERFPFDFAATQA